MRLLRVFVKKTKNGRQLTGEFLGDSGKKFYKSIGTGLERAEIEARLQAISRRPTRPIE